MNANSSFDGIKVAIIDYGIGNVRSIKNAFLHVGDFDVRITDDPDVLSAADCLILPGVGAYRDAMENLRQRNLVGVLHEEVVERQKPVLGVCLGMQLMFEHSDEGAGYEGLGWMAGQVRAMEPGGGLRVPHVGWNDLNIENESEIFSYLGNDKNFYFVHGYHVECEHKNVLATFEYGKQFTAAVQHRNIVGMQFHPERSQTNGLSAIRSFAHWVGEYNHA